MSYKLFARVIHEFEVNNADSLNSKRRQGSMFPVFQFEIINTCDRAINIKVVLYTDI
jgi:hypothetical protein